MSISVIAKITVKPEFQADLETQLHDLVAASLKDEGNEFYSLQVDPEAPTTYYMLERWESEEALKAHEKQPHFLAFVESTKTQVDDLDIKILNTLA